jgi:hypothetical protein
MSTPHFEDSVSEVLSDEDLRQVSGGLASAISKSALAASGSRSLSGALVTGKLPGGVGPFNCNACVQGFPRDLLKDSLTQSAIKVGF